MEFTPIDSFSPPVEISTKPRVAEVLFGIGVVTISIAVLIIAIKYAQNKKNENLKVK